MILIFTGNEQLDKELEQRLKNTRIVYYPDYVLEENEAKVLITALQPNKYNFKEFMFKVRQKNIRVILLLENKKSKALTDALILGIYDIIFDPFTIEDIESLVKSPKNFSSVSEYVKGLLNI